MPTRQAYFAALVRCRARSTIDPSWFGVVDRLLASQRKRLQQRLALLQSGAHETHRVREERRKRLAEARKKRWSKKALGGTHSGIPPAFNRSIHLSMSR